MSMYIEMQNNVIMFISDELNIGSVKYNYVNIKFNNIFNVQKLFACKISCN